MSDRPMRDDPTRQACDPARGPNPETIPPAEAMPAATPEPAPAPAEED